VLFVYLRAEKRRRDRKRNESNTMSKMNIEIINNTEEQNSRADNEEREGEENADKLFSTLNTQLFRILTFTQNQ
jgi:hypothetical protein